MRKLFDKFIAWRKERAIKQRQELLKELLTETDQMMIKAKWSRQKRRQHWRDFIKYQGYFINEKE